LDVAGVGRELLLVGLDPRIRAAGAAAEDAVEAVADSADARRARADAEGNEADGEDEREQHEHPLRVPAQAREEELVFPGPCLALWLRLGSRTLPLCLCGSSGHWFLGYLRFWNVDSVPVEGVADLAEVGLDVLPAQRALQPGRVEVLRLETEPDRCRAVAREVGAEHRRVVGRDRADRPRGDELRERVLRQRADGLRAQVRQWTDVEHDAPAGDLAEQAGILGGTDPVPKPDRAELLERSSHGRRPGDLARVRHRSQAELAPEVEGRLVRLRREVRLEAAEADADDSALSVLRAIANRLLCVLQRVSPNDVRRQAHLDPVQ